MVELQLDTLSVKELRELKDNIESAVRASIRERNKAKLPPMNTVKADPPKIIDLESEARAWLAARRK